MDERYSLYERSRMAITDVQLVHVERVLHERGIRSGEAFLKVLDERTPVRTFFKWRWDTHAKTIGSAPASFTHDRDCFLEQLSDTIATAYMTGKPDWHAGLTAHLQEKHEELDAQFGAYERQYQVNTRDWERVGAVWGRRRWPALDSTACAEPACLLPSAARFLQCGAGHRGRPAAAGRECMLAGRVVR